MTSQGLSDREAIFYTQLFTKSSKWSNAIPNYNETLRFGKICEYLSQIHRINGIVKPLRMLDVGCGRGWLTRLANTYGLCEGVDPVFQVIETARSYFPELTFYSGTISDIRETPNFKKYNVVIASEVIEHVEDKEKFVREIVECLDNNGHVIITTPRGEMYQKWLRLGLKGQPIESWVSEKDLQRLFEQYGFVVKKHDRIYLNLPRMSYMHRLAASQRFASFLERLSLVWFNKGLQYKYGFYQVWWFQLAN